MPRKFSSRCMSLRESAGTSASRSDGGSVSLWMETQHRSLSQHLDGAPCSGDRIEPRGAVAARVQALRGFAAYTPARARRCPPPSSARCCCRFPSASARRPGGIEPLHQARLPPNAPKLTPPPRYLPKATRSGRSARACRAAPRRKARCHHLSNTSTMPCRSASSRRGQKRWIGRNAAAAAHQRFDDDRRQALRVLADELPHPVRIVVVRHHVLEGRIDRRPPPAKDRNPPW